MPPRFCIGCSWKNFMSASVGSCEALSSGRPSRSWAHRLAKVAHLFLVHYYPHCRGGPQISVLFLFFFLTFSFFLFDTASPLCLPRNIISKRLVFSAFTLTQDKLLTHILLITFNSLCPHHTFSIPAIALHC